MTALVFAGDLTFNPLTDTLPGKGGKPFKFAPPNGAELPPRGYDPGEDTYQVRPAPVCVFLDAVQVSWSRKDRAMCAYEAT